MDDLIYKLNKTRDDVNDIITKNKNLVYYMLGLMRCIGDDDCESAAFEGLWDAVETFDVYSKVAFASYACVLIRNRVNGVFRRRNALSRSKYVSVELNEDIDLFYTDEVPTVDTLIQIDKHIEKYLSKRKGNTHVRAIIMMWRNADFDITATEIGKALNVSTSYVCRVQCAFRAYLGEVLK